MPSLFRLLVSLFYCSHTVTVIISTPVSIRLYVCLSVCPPVCLSVCQYVSLSVRLYLSLQIKYMYFIIYVSTCRMLFFFALLFLVFLCLKVKTGTLRFVIKIVRCKLYSLVKKSHDVLKKCQEFFFFLGNNK